MNRIAIILIFQLALLSACARRPVEKEIDLNDNGTGGSTKAHKEIESSPGAAAAPYEVQFIDTMIQVHLSSIDAEQLAATRTGDPELKQFITSVLERQQSEIAAMRGFRQAWFGDRAQAVNLELPGSREALEAIELEKLDQLKERPFDLAFIKEMISHDEETIVLAENIQNKDSHAEITELAKIIVGEKTAEIVRLRRLTKESAKP
jgi:uncharacterized protein (DUF305 family)